VREDHRVPALSRRYLKTAICFLIFGLMLGLHIGAAEYAGWGSLRRPYIVAHTHVLLIGFLLMTSMGVALWVFPRRADVARGPSRLAELAWWLVACGVVARTSFEITSAYVASRPVGIGAFCAACVEAAGIVVFCIDLWPRIQRPREELERRTTP
jgi:hypothetical protein